MDEGKYTVGFYGYGTGCVARVTGFATEAEARTFGMDKCVWTKDFNAEDRLCFFVYPLDK